jgi:hypothetical protein
VESAVKRIGDRELEDDILRVAVGLDHTPSAREYALLGRFSLPTLFSRRTWNEWIIRLFPEVQPKQFPGITPKNPLRIELMDDLRRISEDLGKIPSSEDVERHSRFGLCHYGREFGSLKDALLEIGLSRGLSRDLVEDDIRRMVGELGRIPLQAEFLIASRTVRSSASIARLFGSWGAALATMGFESSRCRRTDPKSVEKELRRWVEAHDGDLSCLGYWKIAKARRRGEFRYSANAVKNCFPGMSWESIMRHCGFPYVVQNQYACRGDFPGKDGCHYLSAAERDAGDALFGLRGSGAISSYEYERLVCPGRKWTCDFVVFFADGRELWLEVDGLGSSRRPPYGSDHDKIAHYIRNGFDYAIVSGWDAGSATRLIVLSKAKDI